MNTDMENRMRQAMMMVGLGMMAAGGLLLAGDACQEWWNDPEFQMAIDTTLPMISAEGVGVGTKGDAEEVVWALKTLLGYVDTDWRSVSHTLEMRSHADSLRDMADAIERKESELARARAVLKKWEDRL